jgi:[glutamine synthetase] adenylyltransferase / [glutamine synthetase]-adenylyl-L-tyrosine phosphorylase
VSEAVWKNAIEQSSVPDRAQRALTALQSGGAPILANADAEQARILCALWSGSEWATEMLAKHPEWLASLAAARLAHPRRLQGLRREVEAWFMPLLEAGGYAEALSKLRQFKQREMICIAARDLARLARTPEIILGISNIADVCLSSVLRLCWRQVASRLGTPFEQDAAGQWRETQFCVLGMGKLGGQELNYSSDVDVLFVYSEEGSVFKEVPRKGKPAKAVLTNHQFFKRIAEAFIAEVGRLTQDGMLFRIDLRLRPEGDAGPLARVTKTTMRNGARPGSA